MKISFDVGRMIEHQSALRTLMQRARTQAQALSALDLPPESPASALAAKAAAVRRCTKAETELREVFATMARRIALVRAAEAQTEHGDKGLAMGLMVLAAGAGDVLQKAADSGVFKALDKSTTALDYATGLNRAILMKYAWMEAARAGGPLRSITMQGVNVSMQWAGKLEKFRTGVGIVGSALTFVGSYGEASSGGRVGKVVTGAFTTAADRVPVLGALDLATGSANGGTGVVGGAGDFYGAAFDLAHHHNADALRDWNNKNLAGDHGYVFKQYSMIGNVYAPAAAVETGKFLDRTFGKNWPFDGDGRPW